MNNKVGPPSMNPEQVYFELSVTRRFAIKPEDSWTKDYDDFSLTIAGMVDKVNLNKSIQGTKKYIDACFDQFVQQLETGAGRGGR